MNDPIFRVTHTAARAITVAVTLSMAVYSDVRCPKCSRIVMAIPGRVIVTTRTPLDNPDRSGRGSVCLCKRCGSLVEAIVVREA